jgi:hypothetical protein
MSTPMMTDMTNVALWADINVLPPKGLNTSIYLDVNNFARHTVWAHSFMHAYALWLGAVLLTIIFLIAYGIIWWRRDCHAAALMGLSGIGTFVALGLNQIVAHLAKELRPYDTLHHVLVQSGAITSTRSSGVGHDDAGPRQRRSRPSLMLRSGLRRSALSRRRGRRPLARRVRRDGCLVGSPDRLSDRGLRRAHSTRPSYRSPARSADGPSQGE